MVILKANPTNPNCSYKEQTQAEWTKWLTLVLWVIKILKQIDILSLWLLPILSFPQDNRPIRTMQAALGTLLDKVRDKNKLPEGHDRSDSIWGVKGTDNVSTRYSRLGDKRERLSSCLRIPLLCSLVIRWGWDQMWLYPFLPHVE